MEDFKQEFLDIFYDNIDRDGADKLLDWLERSDFFTAPASTRHHSCQPGGLCMHSVHVYRRFIKILQAEYGDNWQEKVSAESAAIIALLHDVCKVGYYVKDTKNVKDENGVWQQVPYFRVEDSLPYGHGEKSVYIISSFIKLSREEAMAINWHMGAFDERAKSGHILTQVFRNYPTAFLFHLADFSSTYLDEKN